MVIYNFLYFIFSMDDRSYAKVLFDVVRVICTIWQNKFQQRNFEPRSPVQFFLVRRQTQPHASESMKPVLAIFIKPLNIIYG